MFYVYAIGSMLAYALQQTLLVRQARTMDGFSLAFYRNISFLVTLSPLLIGASTEDLLKTAVEWQTILFSAVAGGLSMALTFGAYRFLSVSFSGALSAAIATLITAALGCVLFSEQLSLFGIVFLALTLLGVLILGFHYKHLPHLDSTFALGLLMALGGGIFTALSKFAVTVLSRETSPFISGYVWEGSIGIACAILLVLRFWITGKSLHRVSVKECMSITLYSSPTLLGTGFFCLAISTGPVAIVSAIGTSGLVVMTLLAWIWYGESLDRKQLLGMALILFGIVGLRFV